MRAYPKTEVNGRAYSNITILEFKCVKNCQKDYQEHYNRCYKSKILNEEEDEYFFTQVSEDLMSTWHKILATAFIAFLLSYGTLVLFRYAINYIIWIIIGSFIALFGVFAFILLFYLMILEAIVFGLITLVGVGIILYFRSRIELIADLFKETSKALIDVPSVLLEPILTFLSLILAFMPFVYFTIVIATAGDPVNVGNIDGSNHVIFEEDSGISFAGFLNVVAFVWFTQFILGCQHFVIAGKLNLIFILNFL